MAQIAADDYVFQNGQRGEQANVLKCSADTKVGDLVGWSALDFLVLEYDLSTRRFVDAGDQVEACCLSGAVRADESEQVSLV